MPRSSSRAGLLFDMYTYKLTDIRVVDGDTIEATIDLGFRIYSRQKIRLAGINAPELNAKDPDERNRAAICMDRVKQLIGAGSNVILDSRRLDKYGRALGSVRVNGTDDIAMALLAEGLVLPV